MAETADTRDTDTDAPPLARRSGSVLRRVMLWALALGVVAGFGAIWGVFTQSILIGVGTGLVLAAVMAPLLWRARRTRNLGMAAARLEDSRRGDTPFGPAGRTSSSGPITPGL